jgi:RNA polymerase sigma factor (sigma-70 family)
VSPARPSASVLSRAFDRARGAEWGLAPEAFATALDASVGHAFAGRTVPQADIDRYVLSLHLEDLALAAACAAGLDRAWDHFVREFRPVLYRAADAIDRTGSARELADSLYGELYGLDRGNGVRASLFRYFHGRSSLATWLRTVLAQRLVDERRRTRRLDPLPADDPAAPPAPVVDRPDRPRLAAVLQRALVAAIATLAAKDRWRLACYYTHDLTLAAIGRLLGEHEATVSRQLARTRRILKDDVERRLREEHGLNAAAIDQCWREAMDDPGGLDVAVLAGARKMDDGDRSKDKEGV